MIGGNEMNAMSILMGSGTTLQNTSMASPLNQTSTPVTAGEGFDLMGFVDALGVAEGPENTIVGQSLDQMSDELVDQELHKFQAKSLVSGVSDEFIAGQMGTSGQQLQVVSSTTPEQMTAGLAKSIDLPEAKLGGDVKLDLNQGSQLNVTPQATKMSEQAVAQWSSALASGDVKSVELVDDQLAMQPRVFAKQKQMAANAEGTIRSLKGFQPSLVEQPLTAHNKVSESAPQNVSELKNLAMPLGNKVGQETQGQTQNLTKGFEVASFETLKLEPMNDESSGDGFDNQGESNSANEFLLSRSMEMSSGPKVDSAATVIDAKNLGEASDMRLADDSVKMLADKVSSLKQNELSTLKVVVNPGESGDIEIRLTQTADGMKVSLSSESKAVMGAIENSKPELLEKLMSANLGKNVELNTNLSSLSTAELKTGTSKAYLSSAELFTNNVQVKDSGMNTNSGFDSRSFSQNQNGQENPQHQGQSGGESSRDRNLNKWRNTFDKQSA